MSKAFGNFKEDLRRINQCLASLEQDARQPCFDIEADVTADKKTRERTEGTVAAVQAKHGDSFSAKRVQALPTGSTSFGMKAKPTALHRRYDGLVDNGAAAPKSFLSPFEMRTPTAAGELFPTGKTSTATKTICDQPPLWFYPAEDISLRTSNQYATNDSSFWKMKVLQTKMMQTLMFDHGGSKGRLRVCLICGT